MKPAKPQSNPSRRWPSRLAAASAASFAALLLGSTHTVHAAVAPLVDVNLTGQTYGTLTTSILNNGSLGGNFVVVGSGTAPSIAVLGSGGDKKTGIQFNTSGTTLLLEDGSANAIMSPNSIVGAPGGSAVYTVIATVYRQDIPAQYTGDAGVVTWAPWYEGGNLCYGNFEAENHWNAPPYNLYYNNVFTDAPAGSWHTLLLTSDGSTEYLYVDNNLITSAGGGVDLENPNSYYPIRLGGIDYEDNNDPNNSDCQYSGAIGSLQIWSTYTAEADVPAKTAAVAPILIKSTATESTISALPDPVSADNSSTITVTMKDGSDNLLASKLVTLARTGGSGTGTPVITTNIGTTGYDGIATFTVACTTPGVYVYTATDVTDSVVVSDTATVTVTTGAATTLVFTSQPGDGVTGAAFLAQPKVTMRDAYGNNVTGTAQNVTLAIQNNAGPGGFLSGTKTVAVDTGTGVATFSGLSIDLAGVGYTLTATGDTVSTTPGAVVSSAFYVVAPGSPPPGYAKILTITLSGYAGTSTLTNFPALVQLGTGITGFAYSDFKSGNNDIRFTDAGGTELPYEIDTWNTGGNSLLWVRVPSVSGTNTVIKMYYGKTGDTVPGYTTDGSTWANNFQAVWHLNTAATSTTDSTGHGHNGKASATGTVTTSTTTAAIGTAGDFRGNGWLVVPASTTLSFPGDFTLSAWVNYPGDGQNHEFLGNWNNGYLWGDNGSALWLPMGSNGWGAGSVSLPGNEWHYLTVTRTGSAGAYTLDGTQVYTWTPGTNAVNCSINDLCIGSGADGFGDGNHPWGGYLDEVRTAGAARSADWIKAEYDNQHAPGTFASSTVSDGAPGNDYASWATANGVTGGVSGDSNHDGVQNGIAYFMGVTGHATNPGLNASNNVTWPMSATFLGTYEVQTSSDLGTWTNVTPKPTASGGFLTYHLPTGQGKKFVRLLVIPN